MEGVTAFWALPMLILMWLLLLPLPYFACSPSLPLPSSPSCPSLAAAAAPDEASREEAEAAASELRAAPKPLEALYNDYAIPSQVGSTAQHSAAWQGRLLQPASGLVGMGQQCLVFPLPADLSQTATHILACATYRLPCRTGRYAWRWFTSPTLVIATTSASCGT